MIPANHSLNVPSVNKNADAPEKGKQAAPIKYFISLKKMYSTQKNLHAGTEHKKTKFK